MLIVWIAHQEGHSVNDSSAPVVATIDDGATLVLTSQYEGITLYTDGTNWWIGI